METEPDDLFIYHDKRLEEFEYLLSQAKSKTLIELIKKAQITTDKSLEKLLQIQQTSVLYLQRHTVKGKNTIEDFKTFFNINEHKFREKDNSMLSNNVKTEVLDLYLNNLKLESNVYSITFEVITDVSDKFETSLLKGIFKPNESEFQYEKLTEILNYIGSKIYPFLDDIKFVASLLTPTKKKKFANSGDKTLVYLEQYIDILEKWQHLGNDYIKIIEQ